MDLETSRLILKSISADDRDFIFSVFSDAVVTKYLYDEEPVTDMEGADEIVDCYLRSNSICQSRWILVRKSDHVKMGTCGFHNYQPDKQQIDIGYDMMEAFWGNGYMQEAIKALIQVIVQELKLKQINAHIYVENDKSTKLVERLGFHFSGMEYNCTFRGKEYLHKIYSLDCTV